MDLTVLILQIVTILVSVTSLVIGFVSTLLENRKKHYVKIVTEQRLKNKEIVRKNISELLGCAHPCALPQFDEPSLKDCCAHAAEAESVLKRFYKEDLALLKAADALLFALREWLQKKIGGDEVERARKALLYEYSVYDFSDWQFIKSQSTGKKYGSDDFDAIYAQSRKNFPSDSV